MYKFLPEDLEQLDVKLAELRERIRDIGQQMGDSCRQGAETYHDNFAYEEGQRQLTLWTQRLKHLSNIRRQAISTMTDAALLRVRFGKKVMCLDENTKQMETYRISSYMTFVEEPDIVAISYTSPLAKLLMDATIDETREGMIGDKIRRYKIIMIW